MKIKLEDILNSNAALGNVLNEKMKVNLAFKFQKVLKFVESNLDLFNNTKETIIKNNELVTDDNGNLLIPEDKQEIVKSEFDELLTQEIDFESEILIEELDGLEITPNDLNSLMWCIKGAE